MGPMIAVILVYLVARTWLAFNDPPWLNWQKLYPPVDVVLISVLLFLSELGPQSNVTLLYLLPIAEAAGSLNIRWAATIGGLVVLGTALGSLSAVPQDIPNSSYFSLIFRLFFVALIASLLAYQTFTAADLREKLGVAADRNRIALEMHDGLQGHLIAIASNMELARRVATSDSNRTAEIAAETQDMARQAADELRFLVHRLRTPALSRGFVPALRQYAHNLCERNGVQLAFEVMGEESELTAEAENALFRISQEALTNIIKHAGAQNIWVEIEFSEDEIALKIRDDGRGIDSTVESVGAGLESMKWRAEKAGGSFSLTCPKVGGTLVKINIRIRPEEGSLAYAN